MSHAPLDAIPPERSDTQRVTEVRIPASMPPPPRPTPSQRSQPSGDAGQQQKHSDRVRHSRISKRRKSSRGEVSGGQVSLLATPTSHPTESSSPVPRSTGTPSASFTPSTKRKIRALNPEGDGCWHCQATLIQICHVIAIKDHEVRYRVLLCRKLSNTIDLVV